MWFWPVRTRLWFDLNQGTFPKIGVLVPSRASSLRVPRCSLRCNISPQVSQFPDLSCIVQHLQHRSHRNLFRRRRVVRLAHMSKIKLQKPTRTAPLSRATPTKPTTNASHIHSHTFPSRILHTGTLYPPLPPTLAPIVYPHRRHIFTSACCCPHVSAQRAKSASLSAARVFPAIVFFNHTRPTPLTAGRASPLGDDNTTIAGLAPELPILGRLIFFLSLPDRYCQLILSISLSVFDRDGRHQVCAP